MIKFILSRTPYFQNNKASHQSFPQDPFKHALLTARLTTGNRKCEKGGGNLDVTPRAMIIWGAH